ncbi:MAG: hypothetical protein P9L91_08825 [Candidatus Zophobacter franzmannii]|nr:hypothetical protein [Candidatus Zophobacter franzmannii]
MSKNIRILGIIIILFIKIPLFGQSFNWFSQSDKAWKDIRLGYSKSISIAKSGCVLSCISMLLNAEAMNGEVTPAVANRWLRRNHGFISADMILEVPPKFDGLLKGVEFEGRTWRRNDWRFLAKHLAMGNKVVAKVGKGNGHWVLVTERNGQLYRASSYKVNDPALKKFRKRSLAYWGSFRSAVAYSGQWIDDTTLYLTEQIYLQIPDVKESFIQDLAGNDEFGNANIKVYNSLNQPINGYYILYYLPQSSNQKVVLDYVKIEVPAKVSKNLFFQFKEIDESIMNYERLGVIFSKGYSLGQVPQNGIQLKIRN